MSANDDRDDRDTEAQRAKDHLMQGLGLLFRGATEAAGVLRKEIDKSNLGRSIDDAGRELLRAANNVVSRLGNDVFFGGPKDKDKERREDEKKREENDPPRWAPGQKPKGPTEEDPGFRIATDDDEPK
ncbi:hypothetical protein [Polyangium aurulentum]|uniref:hypothetical protein n=1 Tax=Polyangium aurulentum TaxID=2567896 RepID=UPI0010AE21F6|nr:hypothetical protein [Polyangium aurulentum]UQA61042.1 hypothetical protein E8A73_011415 [Polyangium aurulentum]